MNGITILGIETSCDETAAAVVKNGREVLSNVIFSQVDLHKKYGGVVPEIASRSHIEKITGTVRLAMEEARVSESDIDAVAVTNTPGLVGALLVGVSFAKALAYGWGKPLIAADHIEAHICGNYISGNNCAPPFVCLVVSGGHTHLVCVEDYGVYKVLGKTRDDAAGEAFDKAARALGLPYPGGVELEKLAKNGNPHAIGFPRATLDNSFDFSFSGLKSAVLNYLNSNKMAEITINKADVAASFQQAVVDVLVKNTINACTQNNSKNFALAGGVSCNALLRSQAENACIEHGINFFAPNSIFCTDNAAMVASCAFNTYKKGRFADLSLNAFPCSVCM